MGNMLDCCSNDNKETKLNVISNRSSTINRVLCTNHPWIDVSPSFCAKRDNILCSNTKTEHDFEEFNGNKPEENLKNYSKINIDLDINASQEKLSPNKLTEIPDLGDSTASQPCKFNGSYTFHNYTEEKIIEDFSDSIKIIKKQSNIIEEKREEVKEIVIKIPIKQTDSLG